MDEVIIRRKLTVGLLFLITIAVSFYSLKSGSALFGGLLVAIPIGVMLLANPMVTAFLVPLGYFSRLMIPGIPGSFTVNYMLQGVLIVWWIGSTALHRSDRRPWDMMDKMVAGFGLVLIFTMAVRGFGIRLMGSMAYGGMGYVYMFLWIGFYFACRQIMMSEKLVSRMVLILCVASFIPVVLLVIVFIHPGLYGTVSRFTTTSFEYISNAIDSGDAGTARWGAAAVFGQFVVYYALVAPFKKAALQKRVMLIAIALLGVLFSGFRSTLAGVIMIIALWVVVKSKNKMLSLAGFGLLALVGWGMAILFVDYLPANMQRTISFLPGVEIYGETARSAQTSVDWRLEVWRYAIVRVPEYLIFGRGLVMDVSAVAWMQRSYYGTPEFAWVSSNYHNGPLSVLLTFGIPGAITFFGFFFALIAYGINKLRQYSDRQHLHAYTLTIFFTLLLCQKMFFFIFVMGQVVASFQDFMVLVVILRWAVQQLEQPEFASRLSLKGNCHIEGRN